MSVAQNHTWHLHLLGQPHLRGTAGEITLSDNTMAVLAHLALEGPTPKYQLAGWLWSDASEENARANMRKLLQRLRKLTGADLILGEDPIRLSEQVEVDVVRLEALALTSESERSINLQGSLLAGLDFDHAPDFEEWLLAARERVDSLRRKVVVAQLEQLEKHGKINDALELAQWAIGLDPLSEEAHRRVMRFAYLLGDRGAALAAYQRCRELLWQELHTEPLPETVQLAALIESGGTVAASAAPERKGIPLTILKPPLVGREREWARMEDAWNKGQTIFLSGAPGVGKSRLMREFAASKGTFMVNEGRPGDQAVPFSSLSRGYRAFFERFPDVSLEPWVRREVSRLVPSLSDETPPPIQTPEEKLRFHDAIFELQKAIVAAVDVILVDDVSFYDPSSYETAATATYRMTLEGIQSRSIGTFRTGELALALLEQMKQLVDQGLVCLIELEPLSEEATQSLLSGIQLEDSNLAGLTPNLHRYAGGNPLFMLETIKDLYESDQLGTNLPARLPLPEKVHALIRRRLERLSPTASRVAQAAAVLQSDFDLELVGAVLGTTPFDLLEPWQELEAAQVFTAQRFSHDLVYEAVQASLSPPVQAFLHRRAAEALSVRQVSPARVARHHVQAGDTALAIEALERATDQARANLQLSEAARFLSEAAELARERDQTQSFDLLERAANMTYMLENSEWLEDMAAQLERQARTPQQQARALHVKAMHLNRYGHGQAAERAARKGLELARLIGDTATEATLLGDLGQALWHQERLEEAVPVLERVCELEEQLGRTEDLAGALSSLGVVLDHLERHREAAELHQRAANMLAQLGDPVTQAQVLNNLAIAQAEYGLVRESQKTLLASQGLLAGSSSDVAFSCHVLCGGTWLDLAQYADALAYIEQARAMSSATWQQAYLNRHLAALWLELGQLDQAEASIQETLLLEGIPPSARGNLLMLQGMLHLWRGQSAIDSFSQAEALLSNGRKIGLGNLWLLQSTQQPPPEALALAQRALGLAEQHELNGLRIVAHTYVAQAHTRLGEHARALEHASKAVGLLDTFDPVRFPRSEVLLTHVQALEAVQHPETRLRLEALQRWLASTLEQHVPPEYRSSFLRRNPINRAILEILGRFNLEIKMPD